MFVHKENTKPSKIPLVIWFVEVFVVLAFCCVVIGLSFIPRLPIYALTGSDFLDSHGKNDTALYDGAKVNHNATVILWLVVTNPNKGKGIIHGGMVITLYKDGAVLDVKTLLLKGFNLDGKGKNSSAVLVNADQQKLRPRDADRNGTLEVGLKTTFRYTILGRTTKRHLLKLEASVAISPKGTLLLGDEGVKLEPVKHKL